MRVRNKNGAEGISNDYGTAGTLIVTNTDSSQNFAWNSKTLTQVTVGNNGSESSHTHSMSGTVTVGSGNYTRPNSVSCLYLISY